MPLAAVQRIPPLDAVTVPPPVTRTVTVGFGPPVKAAVTLWAALMVSVQFCAVPKLALDDRVAHDDPANRLAVSALRRESRRVEQDRQHLVGDRVGQEEAAGLRLP